MGHFNSIEELRSSPIVQELLKDSVDVVYDMQRKYKENILKVTKVDVGSSTIGSNSVSSGGGVIIGSGGGITINQSTNLETEVKTMYFGNYLSKSDNPVIQFVSSDMCEMTKEDNSESIMPDFYDPMVVMSMLGYNVTDAKFDFDNDRILYQIDYGESLDTIIADYIKQYELAQSKNEANRKHNEDYADDREKYLQMKKDLKKVMYEYEKYVKEHAKSEADRTMEMLELQNTKAIAQANMTNTEMELKRFPAYVNEYQKRCPNELIVNDEIEKAAQKVYESKIFTENEEDIRSMGSAVLAQMMSAGGYLERDVLDAIALSWVLNEPIVIKELEPTVSDGCDVETGECDAYARRVADALKRLDALEADVDRQNEKVKEVEAKGDADEIKTERERLNALEKEKREMEEEVKRLGGELKTSTKKDVKESGKESFGVRVERMMNVWRMGMYAKRRKGMKGGLYEKFVVSRMKRRRRMEAFGSKRSGMVERLWRAVRRIREREAFEMQLRSASVMVNEPSTTSIASTLTSAPLTSTLTSAPLTSTSTSHSHDFIAHFSTGLRALSTPIIEPFDTVTAYRNRCFIDDPEFMGKDNEAARTEMNDLIKTNSKLDTTEARSQLNAYLKRFNDLRIILDYITASFFGTPTTDVPATYTNEPDSPNHDDRDVLLNSLNNKFGWTLPSVSFATKNGDTYTFPRNHYRIISLLSSYISLVTPAVLTQQYGKEVVNALNDAITDFNRIYAIHNRNIIIDVARQTSASDESIKVTANKYITQFDTYTDACIRLEVITNTIANAESGADFKAKCEEYDEQIDKMNTTLTSTEALAALTYYEYWDTDDINRDLVNKLLEDEPNLKKAILNDTTGDETSEIRTVIFNKSNEKQWVTWQRNAAEVELTGIDRFMVEYKALLNEAGDNNEEVVKLRNVVESNGAYIDARKRFNTSVSKETLDEMTEKRAKGIIDNGYIAAVVAYADNNELYKLYDAYVSKRIELREAVTYKNAYQRTREFYENTDSDDAKERINDLDKKWKAYKTEDDKIKMLEEEIAMKQEELAKKESDTSFNDKVTKWMNATAARRNIETILTNYDFAMTGGYMSMSFSDLQEIIASNFAIKIREKVLDMTTKTTNIIENITRSTRNVGLNLINIQGNLGDVNLTQSNMAILKMYDGITQLTDEMVKLSRVEETNMSTGSVGGSGGTNADGNGGGVNVGTGVPIGNDDGKGKMSAAMIAGIVVAVILGIVLLVGAVWGAVWYARNEVKLRALMIANAKAMRAKA